VTARGRSGAPSPLPMATIERLDQAAARAWPPIEAAPLAGWQLRASLGGTRRANAVQTIAFDRGTDLTAAIDAAEAWYRARSLPCCFQINPLSRPAGLDAALAARGYAILTPTWVMLRKAPVAPPAPAGVEFVGEPTDAVLEAVSEPGWPAVARRERREIFRRIALPHRFAIFRREGRPVAGGLVVVDGDLAGIFAMRTRAEHRGRGLASRVLDALLACAVAEGARRLYLQVEQCNAPALALYRRVGFREAYAYHYRELRGAETP
jgi:GNAT superfamily N-acetyltransferase